MERTNCTNLRLFGAGVILLFLLSLLWPGDIPWINDEPQLIGNALAANDQLILAREGLTGTLGFRYSPLPTWLYQVFLLTTQDLVLISLGKNILMTFILLASLTVIAAEINFPVFPILLCFVSPYIYYYNRSLWDACFLAPLSALLFMLFVLFVKKNSTVAFFSSLALVAVIYHIHLMSLFIIIPFLLTLLIFERAWIRHNLGKTITGFSALILICLPYLLSVVGKFERKDSDKSFSAENFISGINGIKFFSFPEFMSYFLPESFAHSIVNPPALMLIFAMITCSSLIFFAFGFAKTVTSLWSKYRGSGSFTPADKLALFCLTSILLNVIFYLIIRHRHHPHYLNSVWFAYFFFLWRFFADNFHRRHARNLFVIYFSSMCIMHVSLITFVHVNGGNRSVYYGATLGNQIETVDALLECSPDSKVTIAVKNYKIFPYAFNTLLHIRQRQKDLPQNESKPVKNLLIDYDDKYGEHSGRIKIREVTSTVALERN